MQHALDASRFDKIRPVRDAVMEALVVHRQNNAAKPIEVRRTGIDTDIKPSTRLKGCGKDVEGVWRGTEGGVDAV
eukprot:9503795-Pyramimonas_sp.AAC.4